jgi:4-methyl-5(b-hydroxyethyl)-thiazole monophosphate biosynthesis
MEKILVPIADGSEEVETIAIIDVLRRAHLEVMVASVHERLTVTMAHGVKVTADVLVQDVSDQIFEAIILPGGMPGAEHLRDCIVLIDLLKSQQKAGRWLGAICAAPVVVLEYHGLLGGRKATCYPSMSNQLKNASAAHQRVVVDDRCVTSQGPGTALEFALQWVSLLVNQTTADQLKKSLLIV